MPMRNGVTYVTDALCHKSSYATRLSRSSHLSRRTTAHVLLQYTIKIFIGTEECCRACTTILGREIVNNLAKAWCPVLSHHCYIADPKLSMMSRPRSTLLLYSGKPSLQPMYARGNSEHAQSLIELASPYAILWTTWYREDIYHPCSLQTVIWVGLVKSQLELSY
jgi:hypothetical protein